MMTTHEINSIDLEKENNPEKLKEIIKYWQEKAFIAEYQLLLIRGKITIEDFKSSVNIQKIKDIIELHNETKKPE